MVSSGTPAPVTLPADDPGVITTEYQDENQQTVQAQTPAPAANDPVTAPGSVREQVDLTAAPPAEAPGPLQQAANDLGQQVAPLIAQAPEPVQNLANIVGQPVGGAIDTIQHTFDESAQHGVAGAVGAALGGLSGPYERSLDEATKRALAGQPMTPNNEAFADPGSLTAIPAAVMGTFGPAPAITGGPTYEQFIQQDRAAAQALYDQGGADAVFDAWMTASTGGSSNPTPQLSNPFDAATSDNPIERAGQVLGNVPRMAGDYIKSGKEGTLTPFVIGQAQQAAMDPLTAFDIAGGHKITEGLRDATISGVKKLPIISKLSEYSPAERARLEGEQIGTAGEEYLTAQQRQLEQPQGWTPADPVPTPESAPLDAAPTTAGGVTITPVSTSLGPIYEARRGDQMVAQARTAEELQAQYEAAANEMPDDPITQRRLHDAVFSQNPDALPPPEAQALRNRTATRAAYGNASPGYQRVVEETMPPDPHFIDHVATSKETARLMSEPASGEDEIP
jgi:hypothetical protein